MNSERARWGRSLLRKPPESPRRNLLMVIKPSEKRLAHFRELVAFDQSCPGFGVSLAGMDEVGRGPLAGNVVTACVIMPAEPLHEWVDDSKKLSAKRREEIHDAPAHLSPGYER
ncbi:MAG: hypothetical protein IIY05_01175 [Alistipes sp.]|nr:hypothetical protein [Alistipes sp.]